MAKLRWLGNVVDSVNEKLGRFFSIFLVGLVLVVMYRVISRYFFSQATIWFDDVAIYFFGFVVFLGAGYHLLHNQVIVIDVLYNRFSPKLKLTADTISFLATALFCGVVIWMGGESALRSLASFETSGSVWGPPIYPFRMLIPVAGFLMLAQGTRQYVDKIAAYFAERGENHGN